MVCWPDRYAVMLHSTGSLLSMFLNWSSRKVEKESLQRWSFKHRMHGVSLRSAGLERGYERVCHFERMLDQDMIDYSCQS